MRLSVARPLSLRNRFVAQPPALSPLQQVVIHELWVILEQFVTLDPIFGCHLRFPIVDESLFQQGLTIIEPYYLENQGSRDQMR